MQGKLNKVFGTLAMVAFAAAALGCNKSSEPRQRRSAKLVKAAVASFDPNADVVLDLDAYGSERPDDYAIELAFNQSFDAMDACVLEHKERKKLGKSKQLRGDMQIAVKLNPKGKPLGVNAKLPKRYDKSGSLKNCIRDAVSTAPYPKYDGPPIVAEFETELDAGSEWWDD